MLLETAFICLALNTYHEAKNQSLVGQIATAQVVMNRVEDNRFPNTIWEVVKQGPTRPSWEDPKKEYQILREIYGEDKLPITNITRMDKIVDN